MLNKEIVDDLKDLQGKKVLVRCNLNVPLEESVIQNHNRTDGTTPTIKKLLDQGAKVILCLYLGKPKGEPVPGMSLAPVTPALSERLSVEVKFVDDSKVTGSETRKVVAELRDGEVLLLRDTHYRGEETRFKDGDTANEARAKELADLCNGILVNDVFSTAHRAHCFDVGVTRFAKGNVVGCLTEREIKFPGQVVENPVRSFVTILGSAKVSDKINVINNLLDKVDTLIIGDGMTYTSAKAQGQEIGDSLCRANKLDYAPETIRRAEEKGVKLLLLVDHMEGKEFSDGTEHKVVDVIDTGWLGFNIGPKTITLYRETLQGTETVMWNGPMDVLEFSSFAEGALEVCHAVADLADVATVVGGSGSISAVKRLGFADKMIRIFADGGASLEFLGGKELPGVATTNSRV